MARVMANIEGSVLRWARESAGFSSTAAAVRLAVDATEYEAWEDTASDVVPSIPQLRKVAALFGRPLAVFFLPAPPVGFQVLRDLRRLPGTGTPKLSAEIQLEINVARQRREIALEMAEELGVYLEPFSLAADPEVDPERVGEIIRQALGVSINEQSRWRDADGRAAFIGWRTRIENAGVLVFQTTKFGSAEASGFAISEPTLPIIAVNRADAPTRRTFSLLHELAHLVVRQSGVSELETDVTRRPEDQALEVYCNGAAAAALMPRVDFLAHATVVQRAGQSEAWSDAEIAEISRTFGVSRDAAVRRLLNLGHTTLAFYRRKHAQYVAEQSDRRRRLEEGPKKEMKRNMPQEAISNLGKPLVRMVLGNYHQDRLTLSEVSGYLGLKTKHIPKLEQVAGFR